MKIDGKTKLLCLIGDPVEHSLSPMMYNLSFERLGLNYVYLAFRVTREKLKAAVEGFRVIGVRGFNVTTPLKKAIVALLDRLDPSAAKIGAVNTVLNEHDEFVGFNTDGLGVIKALEDRGIKLSGLAIVLIGAGSAGRAIAYAFSEMPCKLTIMNRTAEKAKALAEELSGRLAEISWKPLTVDSIAECIPRADIVVNATSIGMRPMDMETPIPKKFLKKDMVVFDIVYNPLETRLLREAREIGALTLDGLEMLLHQGIEAFKIWFGLEPPVELLKDAFENFRRQQLDRR